MKNHKNGFTIVEMLVVVAIIGALSVITVPNLIRARVSSNDAFAQATLKSIANALENYASLNSVYPASTTPLLGATPPYLNKDYFTGVHNGFTFIGTFTDYSYSVIAAPVTLGKTGTASYTITTGAVLKTN